MAKKDELSTQRIFTKLQPSSLGMLFCYLFRLGVWLLVTTSQRDPEIVGNSYVIHRWGREGGDSANGHY